MVTMEIRDMGFYTDGKSLALDVIHGCEVKTSRLAPQTSWVAFDPSLMEEQLDEKIEQVAEHILDLRRQSKHEEAIDYSDAFFQSFTPLMNILLEQGNFSQIAGMWMWLISKMKSIERRDKIEFGMGLHKGTAYHFLAFSQLMMRDVDGAYMSFAEAAKEDEIFPKSVLDRHEKGMPPSVKVLLLDLSKQNFAYGLVNQIRANIDDWIATHPDVSGGKSFVESVRNAVEEDRVPPEIAIHFFYALTKAFMVDLWKKDLVRPTFLTITQVGDTILRFARTLEDFVRHVGGLDRSQGIFDYCHDTWFSSENWNVPSYEDDIQSLVDDFLKNNWKLSKEGRNMLFTLKIRNILAHRIPNEPVLFERFTEVILAISASFGYVCDTMSG